MKTQLVPISKVRNNQSNPRIIKDAKFHQLVESIKNFPEMRDVRPIVCNTDMEILGGNMRLKAFIEAGVDKIPVIVVDWSEEKQKEFIVKDNVNFGEWDWDMLANEWNTKDLIDWGLDIPKFENLGEIEAHGRMASTLDEKLDTYLNATIKQIVLYYDMEEYEKILALLNKIAEKNNLDDNSSVVSFLAENYKF